MPVEQKRTRTRVFNASFITRHAGGETKKTRGVRVCNAAFIIYRRAIPVTLAERLFPLGCISGSRDRARVATTRGSAAGAELESAVAIAGAAADPRRPIGTAPQEGCRTRVPAVTEGCAPVTA